MARNIDEALLLFLALVGLYSPVAAVSSYIPLLKPFNAREQLRISLGLFLNAAGIALVIVLIGEPLLVILGLSTAALSATGGIALMYASIPLMRGVGEPQLDLASDGTINPAPEGSWKSIIFMPLTFPFTVGGATVGLLVAFRANVHGVAAIGALSVAAVAYAAVTGTCAYVAGHAERLLSIKSKAVLDRVAGILLTAIAATLLTSGFTQLVVDVLHRVKVL